MRCQITEHGHPVADTARLSAVFTCDRFEVRMNRADYFFGRHEYQLWHKDGECSIAAKKIILPNDLNPTVADMTSL